MEPLRIEWTLARPLRVPEMPIHADALLAWAAVREAEEAGHPEPLSAQDDLPLASEDGDGGAVWCASQLLWANLAPPQQMLTTKRFEADELATRRGKVYVGGPVALPQGTGPYKGFVITTPTVWTSRVVAYVVGERGRVTELLARVTHIGKQRRIGLGLISSASVVDDPTASERWRFRVMPRPQPGYEPIVAVTRPPYWAQERRQAAWMPLTIPNEVIHAP